MNLRGQCSVKHFKWGALFLLCFAILVYSGHSDAQVLDQIRDGYKNASGSWFGKLSVMAQSLFWKLALIEFAWSSILWALQQEQMTAFTSVVVRKIMGIGFFYYILVNADYWIPAIIDSMIQAGTTAGNTGALSPSNIFDTGIDTANKMLEGIKEKSLWDDFATIVVAGISAIFIVIAFLIVAGQLLIAQVESYIAISAGVLFLGFGGSRWTTDFTQKYISYAFATGVKLFMLYLIIGLGMTQAAGWSTMVATTTWNNIFSVLGGALMLAYLAFQIPNMAAAMLSGAPALTGGGFAQTAATVGAGTIAAGAAVASPALQSARGGMQALKAGYDHARAEGSGVLSSALKSVGTSTLDVGREAKRSIAESTGIAPPTSSRMETIGGRASENRRGMTAQLAESNAANSGGGSQAGRAVQPPAGASVTQGGGTPASPSASGGSAATQAAGAASATPSSPAATGMQSNAAGTNSTAQNASSAAQSSGSSQSGTTDFASMVENNPSAIGAQPGGASAESPTAMRSAVAGVPDKQTSSQTKPEPPEKKILSDLHQVRPPQIPNDSAPQAGVNIRLGHSEE